MKISTLEYIHNRLKEDVKIKDRAYKMSTNITTKKYKEAPEGTDPEEYGPYKEHRKLEKSLYESYLISKAALIDFEEQDF